MYRPVHSRLASLAAFALIALLVAIPARAITNGTPDGNGHPNVGALVAHLPFGDVPICSGTLLSPTIFLTAGHCIVIGRESFGADSFSVTFDTAVAIDQSGTVVNGIQGTPIVDPLYGHDQGDFHDLAVIRLASPVALPLVNLPAPGLLDQLAARGALRGQEFTNVGYGATGFSFGGGQPIPDFSFVRRVSTSPFMALEPTILKLARNTHATGEGGTCLGDSGGPHFLEVAGRQVMVAINSLYGDHACVANGFNTRLDTPQARTFLGQFVPLPSSP
jgi:secreted trypsin-like serine protease